MGSLQNGWHLTLETEQMILLISSNIGYQMQCSSHVETFGDLCLGIYALVKKCLCMHVSTECAHWSHPKGFQRYLCFLLFGFKRWSHWSKRKHSLRAAAFKAGGRGSLAVVNVSMQIMATASQLFPDTLLFNPQGRRVESLSSQSRKYCCSHFFKNIQFLLYSHYCIVE